MNTSTPAPTTPASARPSAPFVGMRPFAEGEQDIFYGRDRDAARLRDKVFSARLTLFYGPSGVGKSSILHTLLVPLLAEQRARTIFHDAWRGEEPSAALKARLVAAATELGIPDPGAGAPGLVDLVRLLANTGRETIVLVLDQFEEFFSAHGDRVEPLRRELAQLVRAPGVDVRLVISLREEHLAALEPFRAELLNLFQSTFRLEPLAAPSVRDAIVRPLERFGVSCEPALLEELVADLREERPRAPGRAAVPAEPLADLPLLQLVCSQLWEESQRRGLQTFTQALYHEMGGRHGIQSAYLRRILPARRREQQFTATLMQYLAPGDGHKVGLSAEHLAALTRLPPARVAAELARLSSPELRVLRSRQHGDSSVLYELWHDSFIRIIKPWADAILRRSRRSFRTRVSLGVALGAALLAGGTVGVISHFRQEAELKALAATNKAELEKAEQAAKDKAERAAAEDVARRQMVENVHDVWKPNSKLAGKGAAAKLDHVASYLLWSSQVPDRFKILKDELEKHVGDMPPDYGVNRSGLELVDPPTDPDWPLTLTYSARSNLDPRLFSLAWSRFAIDLNREWGVPVPLRLRLVAAESVRVGEDVRQLYSKDVVLTISGITRFESSVLWQRDSPLMSSEELAIPGREFLEYCKSEGECAELGELGNWQRGVWWKVPRWSLPAWKAAGVLAFDGDALPASFLAERPDRLLTAAAVELVLQRTAERYPETVAEVRARRGPLLVEDLKELVKRGERLTHAPLLLDLLADYPARATDGVVMQVISELKHGDAASPGRLQGPYPAVVASSPAKDDPAYAESAKRLPPVPARIGVRLGSRLEQVWLADGRRSPELERQIQAVLDDVYRRFGTELSSVRFYEGGKVGPDAFQIEVWERPGGAGEVVQGSTAGDDSAAALRRFADALRFTLETHRTRLVISETVERLKVAPALQAWLDRLYSRTDLKQLLRAVVRPSDDERAARRAALAAGELTREFAGPPEDSIQDPEWLLGSLVFWKQVHDPHALPELVEALRSTQRARLGGPVAPPDGPAKVVRAVESGVQALSAGRVPQAERAFAQAVRQGHEAAIAAFLALYPRELTTARRAAALRASCAGSLQRGFSRAERLDLRARVDAADFDASVDADAARSLRLCLLLAELAVPGVEGRPPLMDDMRRRYHELARWPASEARRFGRELLKRYEPGTDGRELVEEAKALIKHGLRGIDDVTVHRELDALLLQCGLPGARRWCRELLPELPLTPVHRIRIAEFFASGESPAEVTLALGLLAQAEKELGPAARQSSARERERIRLGALATLGWSGDADAAQELERILARRRSEGLDEMVDVRRRIGVARMHDRLDEARELVGAARRRWRDSAHFLGAEFDLLLLAGDKDGLKALASEAHGGMRNSEFLFIAALARILIQDGNWEQTAREFIRTGHRYGPYVAIMLAARLTGKERDDAQAVIKREWERYRKGSARWKARLAEGDDRVWREMLLGFAVGEVSREELLADLEDEARYARSELQYVPLPRRGMLCEAYFYAAMVAEMHGDREARRADLARAVQTDYRPYYEWSMAKFLLAEGD